MDGARWQLRAMDGTRWHLRAVDGTHWYPSRIVVKAAVCDIGVALKRIAAGDPDLPRTSHNVCR